MSNIDITRFSFSTKMQRLYDVMSNINLTLHRRLVPAGLLLFCSFDQTNRTLKSIRYLFKIINNFTDPKLLNGCVHSYNYIFIMLVMIAVGSTTNEISKNNNDNYYLASIRDLKCNSPQKDLSDKRFLFFFFVIIVNKTIMNKRAGFWELSMRSCNNRLCTHWAVHDVEPS